MSATSGKLKHADEAAFARLAQSEARFRALVEQISAITYIWTWANDEYIVSYVSPQIQDILGYTPAEWDANPTAWYDWVHFEDRSGVIAENKRCELTAESYAMQYRMVRKDGRIVWVSDAWVVVEDEKGDRSFLGLVFDVTERREAEEALRNYSERLHTIIETQREATSCADLDAVMTLICKRARELTNSGGASILMLDGDALVYKAATGTTRGRIGARVLLEGSLSGWVHRHPQSIICNDAQTDPRASSLNAELGIGSVMLVTLRHGDDIVGQLQVDSQQPNAFADEDLSTLELLCVVLSSALSHAAELEAKREQVEALDELQTSLRRLATIDPLTRLTNRRGFLPIAEHQLRVAQRQRQQLALLFADLDGLKHVNDTLGHTVGDAMITEAAYVIRTTFRATDFAARVGGDEFCVLFAPDPNLAPEAALTRLTQAVEAANAEKGRMFRLSFSTGVAWFDPDAPRSLEELLAEADSRMYENKRMQRGVTPPQTG